MPLSANLMAVPVADWEHRLRLSYAEMRGAWLPVSKR
jgi:hypothetical protein